MLSDEQIARLFRFCEQHFVRHYDVQVELVDHLANAIESKMEENPSISFESALDSVFAGFGVMGFTPIFNARARALEVRYSREKKQAFWSYFTWPRIAGTACLFSVILLAGRIIPRDYLVFSGDMMLFAVYAFEMFTIRKLRKLVKKQTKPLLLTQAIQSQSWFAGVIAWFALPDSFNFHGYEKLSDTGLWVVFAVQALIMVGFLLSSLAYQHIGSRALMQARQDFPEAFTAKTV